MEKCIKRISCASCGNKHQREMLDLGNIPFVGQFPTKKELNNQIRWQLKLMFCDKCKLVQTDSLINPKIAFKNYHYLSSISLSKHFNELANILDSRYNIKGKSILEIGSNDGVLLEPLSKLGAIVEGVDPSDNPVKIAKNKGLKIFNKFFNYENFKSDSFKNKYDLVLANNCFAHIPDIKSVVKGIKHVLKENGLFIFEVHYLENLIKENQWDNIYHEHLYYYSVTAIQNLLKKYGLNIKNVEKIPIHSGSIRVTATNSDLHFSNIDKILNQELKEVADLSFIDKFNKSVKIHIKNFNKEIKELSKKYRIAGYGASGRAGIFCSMTGLDENTIKFIVDDSPERCGRYLSGTKIPIVDFKNLENSEIDIILIFAWNYSKMIIEKTQFKDFKYLVAFPTVQLVNNYNELKGFESI